ncbi:hypothetical protein DFA_09895 [Cavenderia fasciculata]|uniref:TOG domain-containing protein n=1 Tax=Cavenderia fasciculata TaxID=261658 RepID=F4Q8Q3_CACFS|nr:uncharacterized protein DFA_09895 [Cavenderia fasciculata]EGG15072.1 hypothetical protein DFA_09895 [Cavenderia fasciculata]|eukprot:XP_004351792.1 hypothetical protein DFA_09895 [Cavenderia fasciculata]
MMENKVRSRLSTTSSSSPTTTTTSSSSSPTTSRLLSPATKIDTSPIDFDNEKELFKQIEDINNEFKSKESRDWSHRYKALIQLQRIVNGSGIELKQFTVYLRSISTSLIEQVTEVRSTIVKEACAVVELLALRLKARFEPFALLYLQALLKVVVVKVTITAEAAHAAILAILNNVQTKGLLQSIVTASQDQHNEQLRRRSAEYILVILTRAIEEPGMILLTSVPLLERAVTALLIDGGSDIRALARLAFWAYCELNEKGAMPMLYAYTPTTQKNLFAMLDQLPPAQFELASRIHQMQLEEAENLAKVTESMDVELDMTDFKKGDNKVVVNGARAKTPTSSTSTTTTASGRASGLKSRVTTSTTSTTTTSSSGSSNVSGIPRRSGSSLGMNQTLSSSAGPSTSTAPLTAAKKLDASLIVRSKSSLGTTRTPISSTLSTPTSSLSNLSKPLSSTSPNTSTQTGRASSIGSRLPTSAPTGTKPTLSQTLKANQIKSAAVQNLTTQINKPPATLTKSSSKTSLSNSTAGPSNTNASTSTSTTSTTTSTSPVGRLSKSVSSSSLPQRKSITPGSTTSTINKPLSTPTTETLSTKKKFITVTSAVDDDDIDTTSPPINVDDKDQSLLDEKWLSRDVTGINNVEDLMQYSNTLVESLANIEMEIDSLNSESNQFNQISDALANNIRDARKGIDELSIDELDTSHVNNNNNNNSNNNSNGNSSNGNSSNNSSNRNSIVKKEDDEFNWVEDSVDQALIEDDEIDFGESSFKKNNQSFNNNSSSSFKSIISNSKLTPIKDNKRNTLNPDDLLLLDDDLNQSDNDD